MTAHIQAAAATIAKSHDLTELQLIEIIQGAVNAELTPALDEITSLKKLVNETQDARHKEAQELRAEIARLTAIISKTDA